MNFWTKKSIDYANSSDYLDQLYKVYPILHGEKRVLSGSLLKSIEKLTSQEDDVELLRLLISETNKKRIVFPIKDSFVAYLKHDETAISRNPHTVNRIAGELYSLGYEDIIYKAAAPKETNRQIGPLFGEWIRKRSLGCKITNDVNEFLTSTENIVLDGTDATRTDFAVKHFGFKRQRGFKKDKGIDFLAKFNNRYVLGEAKFLSDFGGSQNSDFEDAVLTLRAELDSAVTADGSVIKIAIIDGVLYINKCAGRAPASDLRTGFGDDEVILSSLLLRSFLYSL